MKSNESPVERRLALDVLRRDPAGAAPILETTPVREAAALVASLSVPAAVALLDCLTPETAAALLEELDDRAAGALLAAMDPPTTVVLLSRLEPDARERRLGLLDKPLAKELRELARYPSDSAGALMDPRVLGVRPETTVGQALVKLRAFRNRRVRRLFVLDEEGKPVGSVRLQEVAMEPPSRRLDQIMARAPVTVLDTASREEVVDVLTRTRLSSIPVTSFDGRLVGVIRDDVLMDAAQAEATADMQTMVGASREERALSPVGFAVRKRLPWLEVNLGTAFLAAAVVGLFEGTIARFTALAVLLPVVAGQSGNTGAQALAVTMRGLALREIRVRHWVRVAHKEVRVAFLNGIAVAVTTAAAVWLWSRSPGLTLVIGVSMVLSMVAAGLAGASIPLLLTAARQDPAQSSSIILTTVTDVVGFLSFLGIATLLASLI